MKKLIFVIAAGVLATALVIAGCGGDQTQMENNAQTQAESATQQAGDMAKTAEATAETAVKPYPLDYCIVSGEKLGEMGEPVVKTYGGQEVKFCCNMCVPKFEANPAAFLAKLDSAAAGVDMSGSMDHDHM